MNARYISLIAFGVGAVVLLLALVLPHLQGEGTAAPASTTPSTTKSPTTSTAPPRLSPERLAYGDNVAALAARLDDLATVVLDANQEWEDRSTSLAATTESLELAGDALVGWARDVASIEPPEGHDDLSTFHGKLLSTSMRIANQAANALDALVNASTSEPRREAISKFDKAVRSFKQTVESVVQEAAQPRSVPPHESEVEAPSR